MSSLFQSANFVCRIQFCNFVPQYMNVAKFMKDLLTRLNVFIFCNIPLIDHEHVFSETTLTNVQFSKLYSKSIPYPVFL